MPGLVAKHTHGMTRDKVLVGHTDTTRSGYPEKSNVSENRIKINKNRRDCKEVRIATASEGL